jgi:hypothetical protein
MPQDQVLRPRRRTNWVSLDKPIRASACRNVVGRKSDRATAKRRKSSTVIEARGIRR